MAATEGNQYAVGNSGGKTVNDRKKAAKARNLILDQVILLFEMDPLKMSETEIALKRELLVKMAPSTLPRLTEVTGEDGEAIKIVFDKVFIDATSNPSSKTAGDNQV